MTMAYRGYLISPIKGGPRLLGIATEGRGGKIPSCLTGAFTSLGVAKSEIDKYLESKVKPDAKATSEGRG